MGNSKRQRETTIVSWEDAIPIAIVKHILEHSFVINVVDDENPRASDSGGQISLQRRLQPETLRTVKTNFYGVIWHGVFDPVREAERDLALARAAQAAESD
ncbi:hypothetical protein K4K58_000767 [Colletotrichum sp. SAR11_239]|nr:hypothetical protein K4K58_000767 [Colletotrichum sp. SAR11_239]